jgi:hypothetical protein
MGRAVIDFVRRAVLWRLHGQLIQNAGKSVACDLSLLPKRVCEEKWFGEIVEFEEAVRRRWGSEFIGRGEREVWYVCPFWKIYLVEMTLD